MDYDQFSLVIWNNHISYSDISSEYRNRNQEYLDQLTFFMYGEAMRFNLSDVVCARMIKKSLDLMILYKPSLSDDGTTFDPNQESNN